MLLIPFAYNSSADICLERTLVTLFAEQFTNISHISGRRVVTQIRVDCRRKPKPLGYTISNPKCRIGYLHIWCMLGFLQSYKQIRRRRILFVQLYVFKLISRIDIFRIYLFQTVCHCLKCQRLVLGRRLHHLHLSFRQDKSSSKIHVKSI